MKKIASVGRPSKSAPKRRGWADAGALLCQLVFLAFYGAGLCVYVARHSGAAPLAGLPFFSTRTGALPFLCIALTPVFLSRGAFLSSRARKGGCWPPGWY